MRRLNALEALLDLDAQTGAVAQAIAAEFAADARFTCAECLAVGVAGRHP